MLEGATHRDSQGEYLRKRRLDFAAAELVYSNQRVIDIVVKCGFSVMKPLPAPFVFILGSQILNAVNQS